MLLQSSFETLTPNSMQNFIFEADDYEFGTFDWFLYAGISCFLVIFAGIMSGLTLGLMSLGLVELEILQRSGTSTEKKQAGFFSSLFSWVFLKFLYLFLGFF